MSLEDNKALVRRWVEEFFNAGNLAVADEIISPNHGGHDPNVAYEVMGPAGQRQLLERYRSAFPDARMEIFDEQIAEGDRVATSWDLLSAEGGRWLRYAPTGTGMFVWGVTIHRISEGKIEESRVSTVPWDLYVDAPRAEETS